MASVVGLKKTATIAPSTVRDQNNFGLSHQVASNGHLEMLDFVDERDMEQRFKVVVGIGVFVSKKIFELVSKLRAYFEGDNPCCVRFPRRRPTHNSLRAWGDRLQLELSVMRIRKPHRDSRPL
jgi:hypothetical protein